MLHCMSRCPSSTKNSPAAGGKPSPARPLQELSQPKSHFTQGHTSSGQTNPKSTQRYKGTTLGPTGTTLKDHPRIGASRGLAKAFVETSSQPGFSTCLILLLFFPSLPQVWVPQAPVSILQTTVHPESVPQEAQLATIFFHVLLYMYVCISLSINLSILVW